jgi:hypothetical protein
MVEREHEDVPVCTAVVAFEFLFTLLIQKVVLQ